MVQIYIYINYNLFANFDSDYSFFFIHFLLVYRLFSFFLLYLFFIFIFLNPRNRILSRFRCPGILFISLSLVSLYIIISLFISYTSILFSYIFHLFYSFLSSLFFYSFLLSLSLPFLFFFLFYFFQNALGL